jgi:hypothetical protein
LVRLRIRERRQQCGVKDAEDSGVRADAQRESKNGHGSEARIFSQQPKSKAGVTEQVIQTPSPSPLEGTR